MGSHMSIGQTLYVCIFNICILRLGGTAMYIYFAAVSTKCKSIFTRLRCEIHMYIRNKDW